MVHIKNYEIMSKFVKVMPQTLFRNGVYLSVTLYFLCAVSLFYIFYLSGEQTCDISLSA